MPRDPSFMVPYYDDWFGRPGQTYDGPFLDDFFASVRRWRSSGVTVLGYVAPDSPGLREHTRAHGFDPETLRRRFAAAGGTLISVADTASTIDGQHLVPREATALSERIGGAIVKQLMEAGWDGRRVAGHGCEWPVMTRERDR